MLRAVGSLLFPPRSYEAVMDLSSLVRLSDPSATDLEGGGVLTTASVVAKHILCPYDHDAPVVVHQTSVYCDERLHRAWRPHGGRYHLPVVVDLHVAALSNDGRECATADTYELPGVKVQAMAALVGLSCPMPDYMATRRAKVRLRRHRISVTIAREAEDPTPDGWVLDGRSWERVLGSAPRVVKAPDDLDNLVRCLAVDGGPAGWRVRTTTGWSSKSQASVRTMLQDHYGIGRSDADILMGRAEWHPWELVVRPFAPEYPGGRVWNPNAPQVRYAPIACDDWRTACPHWYRVLSHIGSDMDAALAGGPIPDGAIWLLTWLAAMIQRPECKTPYLFLFGPQNSGKSIFHEAFELLVTSGVVQADRALTSQSDFNGELEGAILCVVEEKDISKSHGAHAKIKSAVTALRLSIRKMRTDTYMVNNMTHWVQMANHRDACPLFDGDTRIQPVHVRHPDRDIPKEILLRELTREAPAFTYALLNTKLPESSGRLALPVVDTATRLTLQEQSIPGWLVELADLAESNDICDTAPRLAAHIDGLPRDVRIVRREVEANAKYLGQRRIVIEIVRSGSNTRKLSVRKLRAYQQ